MRFPMMGKVIQPPFQVEGHKGCPFCKSIDLHYPSSSISTRPFPFGPIMTDDTHFPSYSSFYCLTCERSFAAYRFIPDASGFTAEQEGSDAASF
jgi:hypothetical protein